MATKRKITPQGVSVYAQQALLKLRSGPCFSVSETRDRNGAPTIHTAGIPRMIGAALQNYGLVERVETPRQPSDPGVLMRLTPDGRELADEVARLDASTRNE